MKSRFDVDIPLTKLNANMKEGQMNVLYHKLLNIKINCFKILRDCR